MPRCLFVDLEPTVVDEVRTGFYKNLYHPEQLISGKEDASNNFARGYYTIGKNLHESINKRLRTLAEHCASPQGIMIFNSVGGGTGSGLSSLILEELPDDFKNKSKISFNIFPSPQISTTIVEPYNCMINA